MTGENKNYGYEAEQRADDRGVEQERRFPGTHGDIITADDFCEWKLAKEKEEKEEKKLGQKCKIIKTLK